MITATARWAYDFRSGPSPRPTGLDYVSCSPYRVPIARVAAAQAALAKWES
jgi:phosphoenolpyruvate synthase/pyruvate phosphate dikinase